MDASQVSGLLEIMIVVSLLNAVVLVVAVRCLVLVLGAQRAVVTTTIAANTTTVTPDFTSSCYTLPLGPSIPVIVSLVSRVIAITSAVTVVIIGSSSASLVNVLHLLALARSYRSVQCILHHFRVMPRVYPSPSHSPWWVDGQVQEPWVLRPGPLLSFASYLSLVWREVPAPLPPFARAIPAL